MAKLDLKPLRNAAAQLEEAIGFAASPLSQDVRLYHQFRNSSIQAFEFTYELSHKMLKRHLQNTEPDVATIDELSYRGLIRLGFEKGLIANPEKWFKFRDLRNMTSHTYDEEKAEDAMTKIPAFLEEAKHLLSKLEEGNASG